VRAASPGEDPEPSQFHLGLEEAVGDRYLLAEDLSVPFATVLDGEQVAELQWSATSFSRLPLTFAAHEAGGGGAPAYTMPKGRRFMIGQNRMDTTSWVTTGVLVAGLGALLAEGDYETIRDIGDVTQFLPMAFALPMTWVARDKPGRIQFFKHGIASGLIVHGIKEGVEKVRPDLSDTNSFPSGHTNASFTGAAFLQRRYGPRWGVPAYIVASYTGISRVVGNKHFMDDVLGGMSIALMTNWLFVEPMNDRFLVTPIAGDGAVGLNVAITTGGTGEAPQVLRPKKDRPPHYRFEFEFGGAWARRNIITTLPDGETIDWLFDENANPTTTSNVGLEWFPNGNQRHGLLVRYSPFEVRDLTTLTEPTPFSGVTLPANEELRTGYVFYEWRLRYRYDFFPNSRFKLKLGGAISVEDVQATLGLQDPDGTEEPLAEYEDTEILPLYHLHLGVDLTRRLSLIGEVDGNRFGDEEDFVNSSLALRLSIGRRWDVSLGFRRIEFRFETDEFKNLLDLDRGILGFSYSW
jgi:membrane-associated phospholipid phosphatase